MNPAKWLQTAKIHDFTNIISAQFVWLASFVLLLHHKKCTSLRSVQRRLSGITEKTQHSKTIAHIKTSENSSSSFFSSDQIKFVQPPPPPDILKSMTASSSFNKTTKLRGNDGKKTITSLSDLKKAGGDFGISQQNQSSSTSSSSLSLNYKNTSYSNNANNLHVSVADNISARRKKQQHIIDSANNSANNSAKNSDDDDDDMFVSRPAPKKHTANSKRKIDPTLFIATMKLCLTDKADLKLGKTLLGEMHKLGQKADGNEYLQCCTKFLDLVVPFPDLVRMYFSFVPDRHKNNVEMILQRFKDTAKEEIRKQLQVQQQRSKERRAGGDAGWGGVARKATDFINGEEGGGGSGGGRGVSEQQALKMQENVMENAGNFMKADEIVKRKREEIQRKSRATEGGNKVARSSSSSSRRATEASEP